MTTSSRMDQSIRPGYPHQHHVLQESLHPHHPFSLATTVSNSNGTSSSINGDMHGAHSNNNTPLPPLACLSEAAAAISSAVQQQQQQQSHNNHMGRDHHRYHSGHPMTTNSNTTPNATSKLTGTGLGGGNNSREGDTGRGPQLPSPESSSSHHRSSSSSSMATLSTFGSTTLSSTSSSASSTVATGTTTTSSANHGSSLFDHPHPHSHSHSQHPHQQDTTMNTASAGTAVHEGTKRPGDDGARRGSIPDHHYSHHNHHQGHQGGSLTTPAPSPHGRPSSASSADYPPQPSSSSITPDHYQQPSSYQQQRYSNGHPTSAPSPDHYYKDHQYPSSQPYPSSQQPAPPSSQLTPSPPLPSPADGFQGRPLPPIEPSHPLHSYMSNSRRGSVTDPDYHASAPDVHKRPSISAMDSSSFYNSNGNSNTNGSSNGSNNGPAGPGGQESRHYANSSPSSIASSSSEPHYPPYPHPSTSPMQLRQSEHVSGRRESLPSIHSSAGPLGQLLAQEPQRRHSIAHGDQMMGPLKRKTSSTPLSQMHSSSELEHPAKRRDSIPDAAHPLHHHHHPYPPRSSFSAPSSPPRRGSNAMMHGPVPTLNLQPAAEIKSSMMPSSNSALHNGPGGPSAMDHVRPHFPLHQPRRPSLLSDASLSRRSSVADNHHYPSHYQPSSSSQHQDYDHNMDMDMERMHLHGPPDQPPSHTNPAPLGPGSQQQPASHLYPGYPAGYPGGENGHKGDTPYSRSPELRVSHKLAERKRRKEMKELFDELRDALPVDRSLKTSKWEILSKAVDYISGMRENQEAMGKEIDMLRQEVARLKNL